MTRRIEVKIANKVRWKGATEENVRESRKT